MKKSAKNIGVVAMTFLQFDYNKAKEPTKSLGSYSSTSKVTTSTPVVTKTTTAPLKTYDGPLGLEIGIPIDILVNQLQLKELIRGNTNFYSGSPAKHAPSLDSYFVIATQANGVCKVGAIANVNVVNNSGDQIKSETDRIAEMVELKYGKPTKKYDFASQDVYRKNAEFFLMALRQDAVTYAYSWANKSAKSALPSDLIEI